MFQERLCGRKFKSFSKVLTKHYERQIFKYHKIRLSKVLQLFIKENSDCLLLIRIHIQSATNTKRLRISHFSVSIQFSVKKKKCRQDTLRLAHAVSFEIFDTLLSSTYACNTNRIAKSTSDVRRTRVVRVIHTLQIENRHGTPGQKSPSPRTAVPCRL